MQQKTLIIALAYLLTTGCTQQKEESANPSDDGQQVALTKSVNQIETSIPDQSRISTSKDDQSQGEQAAAKVMQQYNQKSENKKYERYAQAIVSAIDEADGSFQFELDSATESSSLFQSSGIKDMTFINGDEHSATYRIKVNLMRGGHVESQCSMMATYDDSIGQINWKIPQTCFDF